VINWSYSDQRVRLRLPVMVSYDDDPEAALDALLEATQNHPRILRDPAPVTRLMSFDDYGMKLEVRFWIADPMNGVNNGRSGVNRAVGRGVKGGGNKVPGGERGAGSPPPAARPSGAPFPPPRRARGGRGRGAEGRPVRPPPPASTHAARHHPRRDDSGQR